TSCPRHCVQSCFVTVRDAIAAYFMVGLALAALRISKNSGDPVGGSRPIRKPTAAAMGSTKPCSSLEVENDAARVAETVLTAVAVGRQSKSQRFGWTVLGPQVVQLCRSNRDMSGQPHVDSAAKRHGERVRAADIRADPSQNWHADSSAQPRQRFTEQSMSEYPEPAEVRAYRRAKQQVVHRLVGARRKSQRREANRGAVVPVKVRCQTKVRSKVERRLSIPPIKVVATVIQKTQGAVGALATPQVRIAAEKNNLGRFRLLGE